MCHLANDDAMKRLLKAYVERTFSLWGLLTAGRRKRMSQTREVKFLSNDYTNNNTDPKTLLMLILTLTDPHDAFESFCEPAFCDFVRNYSCTVDGAVVTSSLINNWWINSDVGL